MASPLSSSGTSQHDTALLAPWLLLLLRDGESYGRALFGRLSERGINVDSSFGYRTLRALEGDEAVTSRRAKSDRGPLRRCYRLTRKGRHRLDELAADIAAAHRLQARFLEAYEREHGGQARDRSPRLPGDHDAASSSLGRELLAAWLLLLLHRGESYGYGLREALAEREVQTDRGGMYRLLRALERGGSLQSHWTTSATGPRRRSYRVTPAARRHLAELAHIIAVTHEGYGAFLKAYADAT
ncbi:MAG: PadR family transcriptional regulator [Thermoleophilia bacterium]